MNAYEPGIIRLLLVDRHDMVRTGLRQFVAARNIEIVGECSSLSDGVATALRLQPNVVLMEYLFPDGSSLQACREIRAAYPAVRVMFLTGCDDDDARLGCILAGGDAYLLKDIGAAALMDAIEMVAAGRPVLDAAAIQSLLKGLKSVAAPPPVDQKSLSPQERKLLPLVAAGKTNKEIGVMLGLSHKTVKNYLSNVYQKLQVTRRSQVAAMFAGSREQ
jgi:two-component system, NarL family, response regulator DevR